MKSREEIIAQLEQQAAMLSQANALGKAEPVFAKLSSLEPEEPRHRLNWAYSLIDQDQFESAASQLRLLPAAVADWPLVPLAKGMVLFGLARYQDALSEFERAHQLDPDLHLAFIFQLRILLLLGDRLAAEKILKNVPRDLDLVASDAEQLGRCFMATHQYEAAISVLERARQHSPKDTGLLTALIELKERRSQLSDAENLLSQVVEPSIATKLLRARLLARTGRLEEALSLLVSLREELTENGSGTALLPDVLFELGKWLDRAGFYTAAWEAYSSANLLDRASHRAIFPERWDVAPYPSLIDPQSLDIVILDKKPQKSAAQSDARLAPVFLVGFPRSGTTLLDTMLNSHPRLQVLDEKLSLEPVMMDLQQRPGGYPGSLAELTEQELNSLRRRYWAVVDTHLKLRSDARVVDKYPLNLLRAHLILRLFPDAKWIFAVRNPMDVLLSCFMQRFDITDLTRGFSDPLEIAELYSQSVELWLKQSNRLELRYVEVRYEGLVAGADTELRRVVDYLDLPWDDRMLGFDPTSSGRWISTPSYDQVTRPLYAGSIGRWRNYRQWLEPAVERVSTTARKLGYDLR